MFTTKNLLIIIGRNALVSLVVIITAIIVIFFLANETEKVSESVALYRRLQGEFEKRTIIFEGLKLDAEIVGTNDIKIKNAFVPTDNILEFVSMLDSLAAKNTLAQTYRFETPTSSSISSPFPISTINYSNSFSANVLSFSNYLKEFNNIPYYSKIDGFTITSHDQFGWLGASTITLRATLYTNAEQ